MFDRAWDRVMHSHNKMTGMKIPTMTLFDERWSKVMKKHMEMTAIHEDRMDKHTPATTDENMTTGQMAEHILARVEEVIDEDTTHAEQQEEEAWASRSFDESQLLETFDKSWDRVMGTIPRSYADVGDVNDVSNDDSNDVSSDVSEGERPVEYIAKIDSLTKHKPPADPHMKRKLMWLVALCFSYMAYCGFTRLIQQQASHTGEPADFSQLDLAVSRIFFFTTITSNNFADFTRKLRSRQQSASAS